MAKLKSHISSSHREPLPSIAEVGQGTHTRVKSSNFSSQVGKFGSKQISEIVPRPSEAVHQSGEGNINNLQALNSLIDRIDDDFELHSESKEPSPPLEIKEPEVGSPKILRVKKRNSRS